MSLLVSFISLVELARKAFTSGSSKDRIVFLEPNSKDSLVTTWWFYLSAEPDPNIKQYRCRETLRI